MAESLDLGAPEFGVQPPERAAAELAGKIRVQAELAAMEGKFSPLIRLRGETGELLLLYHKRGSEAAGEIASLIQQGFSLDQMRPLSLGWTEAGVFGRDVNQYRQEWEGENQRDPRPLILDTLFPQSRELIAWRENPDRQAQDYVEVQPTAKPGVVRLRFSFVVSPASALDSRGGDVTFAALLPSQLGAEVLAVARQHPDIILPLIHCLYPGTGEPLPTATASKPTRVDLAQASTINRRAAVESIRLVDYSAAASPRPEIIRVIPPAPSQPTVAGRTINSMATGGEAELKLTPDQAANANAVASILELLAADWVQPSDRKTAYRVLLLLFPRLDAPLKQKLYQEMSLPGIAVKTLADAVAVLQQMAKNEGIDL